MGEFNIVMELTDAGCAIDGPWRLRLACLTALTFCLIACGTVTVDNPPDTVGMSYDNAQRTLLQWCSNVQIRVDPAGKPPTAADSQLFVSRQRYTPPPRPSALSPAPVPQRSVAGVPLPRAAIVARPATAATTVPSPTPSPPTQTTRTSLSPTPRPTCDTSVAHEVHLLLVTKVPDLHGVTLARAQSLLDQHGLALEVRSGPTLASSAIQTQDPLSGTQVDIDQVPYAKTRVSVGTVPSTTPSQPRTVVPDVQSMDEVSACAAVERAQLRCVVHATGSGPTPGTVTLQSPAYKTDVGLNTDVNLTVVRRIPVPDVRNQSMDQACAAIRRVALTCVTPPAASAGATGQVVEQSPPPGTPVDDGATVALQVQPSGPIPVPGGVIAAALALLVAAAAAIQRYRKRHPPRPPRVVVRLRPDAPQVRENESREW